MRFDIIICDFDGTITLKDTTDLLLNRFADPGWLDIEKDWLKGKIGSRECLERQLQLVRADEEDLNSLLTEIPLDPGFPLFASYCKEENIPLVIATDSFDFLVTPLLKKYKLGWIPTYTNRLRFSKKQLIPGFPYADPQCANGNCKCSLLRLLGIDVKTSALIGDGASDFCLAGRVSAVFARKSGVLAGGLLEFCQQNNIECHAFASFQDVSKVIERPKNA